MGVKHSFCGRCGALLTGGTFCAGCGARGKGGPQPQSAPERAAPALPSPSKATLTPAPELSQTAPPKTGSSRLLRIFLYVVEFVVLLMLLALGSCAYIAYKAKKRVDAVQQAYKEDDPAGMIRAIQGETSNVNTKPPDWKPAPPDLPSSPAGSVPLKASLRLVRAGSDPIRGDFESIFEVDTANSEFVHVRASEQYPSGNGLERLLSGSDSSEKAPGVRKTSCGRTILRTDLETSSENDESFCVDRHETKHPGMTAMEVSKAILQTLKSAGRCNLTTRPDPMQMLFKSLKHGDSGSGTTSPLPYLMTPPGSEPPLTPPISLAMQRADATDLAYPVLVNERQAELPVVHVTYRYPGRSHDSHIYILDDPENPLILAAQADNGHLWQMVKISWKKDNAPAASQVEDQLAKNGRARVYGIHFDFGSDVLRPESREVLTEIAGVLRDHPDWKLAVEGHTDNIGGDASNSDLSTHRAHAVKDALANQFHVDPERLSPAGFGATRPVGPNDTLEGRALNRRVELVRQ